MTLPGYTVFNADDARLAARRMLDRGPVQDNDGRAIYGGSDLVCLRGGWEALKTLALTPESRAAVAQAKFYYQSMSEYPGFMASRRNYDVPRASIRMVGADPGCSSRHGAWVVRAALNSPRSQNSRRIPRCRL